MKDDTAQSLTDSPALADMLEAIKIQEIGKRLEDHHQEVLRRLAAERRYNLSRRGRFKSWRWRARWRLLNWLAGCLSYAAGTLADLSEQLYRMSYKR